MSAIVSVDSVAKTYGDVSAVADVSLALMPGEALALVGHNGAGKTTLVKLILGLVVPDSGRVRVFGEDPAASHSAAVRRALGFLPESVAFHAAMTGRELLDFSARRKGEPRRGNDALLERVGLADAARRRVGTYSKGMRQRLGLAQALIGSPKLLLLDEPTSGLDPESRGEFYTMVDRLRRDGVTVLISTHALAEIEAHADRIAVLHRGRLIALGRIAELRQAAALPVRMRLTVAPCTTARVLARLGDRVEVLARGETHLALACEQTNKMALLQRVADAPEIVDIEIESPGLEALYGRLIRREESA